MKNKSSIATEREKEAKGKLRKFIIRHKIDKIFLMSLLPFVFFIPFVRDYLNISIYIYPIVLFSFIFIIYWWNDMWHPIKFIKWFWNDEDRLPLEDEKHKEVK